MRESTTIPEDVRNWLNHNRYCAHHDLENALLDAGVHLETCISWVQAFFGKDYVSLEDYNPASASMAGLSAPCELQSVEEGVTRTQFYSPAGYVPKCSVLDVSSGFLRAQDSKLSQVGFRCAHARVLQVLDVLTPEECDALISGRKGRLVPSTVITNGHKEGTLSRDQNRTSQGSFYDRGSTAVVAEIERKLSSIFGFPEGNGEPLQILNYVEGGEYKPHYDFFEADTLGGQQALSNPGGNRVATIIMYLNEVDEGGETIFPKHNIKIKSKKGSIVYFDYRNSDGSADRRSLHGGAPVVNGEKWIATKWVREFFVP